MRLRYTILLSLVIHLLVLAPPLMWPAKKTPRIQPRISVTIEPIHPAEELIDDRQSAEAASAISTQQPNAGLKQFQRQAQSAISKQLLYPPEAIERGLEGDVTLLLTLDNNGRVQSAEIARSSGHALLDAAALSAAQRLGRLPGNARESLVPISFRLD